MIFLGAVQNEQELNLCLLPKLYKIDLSDNSYFEFPQSLCKARSIVKLNMSGNPIRYINIVLIKEQKLNC